MKEKQNITLPKTEITPARGRIYCMPYKAEESKTDSGILLLTNVSFSKNKDKTTSIEKHRYIVVAVGELNGMVKIKEADGSFRDVRRGDEVHWYVPQKAIGLDWALVTDFDTGEDMVMFDESELSGAQPCLSMEME